MKQRWADLHAKLVRLKELAFTGCTPIHSCMTFVGHVLQLCGLVIGAGSFWGSPLACCWGTCGSGATAAGPPARLTSACRPTSRRAAASLSRQILAGNQQDSVGASFNGFRVKSSRQRNATRAYASSCSKFTPNHI